MRDFGLPKTVNVDGKERPVSTDFRVILDICDMLTDSELTEPERAYCALFAFYKGRIPQNIDAALVAMYDFIAAGTETDGGPDRPRLMDWSKDYGLIIPAINRVVGTEVRALEYMHWWTFVGAYMEIGECLFSTVLTIRGKKAKGKKLEKYEQEFARENARLVQPPCDTALNDIERLIREGGAVIA